MVEPRPEPATRGKITDCLRRTLLRACGERPCGRAAEKRDELTPFQLIESPSAL
jgi:hypothetical protein